jgi:hypothetical protein
MPKTDTMIESKFAGIYEGAFANPLLIRQYDGFVDGEVVTEVWYKLSLDEAKRFIKNHEYTELKIEEGEELPGSWIKFITTEYRKGRAKQVRLDALGLARCVHIYKDMDVMGRQIVISMPSPIDWLRNTGLITARFWHEHIPTSSQTATISVGSRTSL